MAHTYTWYQDLANLQFSEGSDSGWIELARVGEYTHPMYGKIDFTPQKLKEFADNFDNNVRGIEIDIDYNHKNDAAHGSAAAGWLKQVKFDGTALKGFVEWTSAAAKAIRDKAYKYFSPEYRDEWTDAQGTTHKNVLFGGGITNRPFLKDLLPINLSELTFQDEPAPQKENEVDPKQLRASIGLAEDATDADVTARLALIKQLSEAFPSGPPKIDPTPAPPAPAPVPTFNVGTELKQLAETNPSVKGLLNFVEATVQENKANAKKLTEQNVNFRLNEFDKTNSKLVLTPVARDLVTSVMLDESMTEGLREKIWSLMEQMRDGNKFFIELGERASSAVSRTITGATATEKYNGLVKKLMEEDKLDYASAATKLSNEYPDLFEDYRRESFAFVE